MNDRCPSCHKKCKIRRENDLLLYYCDCGGSYRHKYTGGIVFCSNPYFLWVEESKYGTIPSSSPTYCMAGMLVTI